MGKKLQTIYEYFREYQREEIEKIILSLSIEEKELLKSRYGDDLKNPKTSKDWDKAKSNKFYKSLLPKIKRKLIECSNKKIIIINHKIFIEESPLEKLIKQGKTNNEICELLNIDKHQLYNELLLLRNLGKTVSREYYSNGSIRYQYMTNFPEATGSKTILSDINENKIKILAISDLHIGNSLDRLDLINRAFNYCSKNNISIILSCGDLIDGCFAQSKQKISNPYEQIEFFIEKYPYDKNIITFSVFGNHERSLLKEESLNLSEICNNYRHDIVINDSNKMNINIKNDQICLMHIKYSDITTTKNEKIPITLYGHTHKFAIHSSNKCQVNINVPSLSNILNLLPSALELELSFSNGRINDLIVKQICFDFKDIVLGEFTFDAFKFRNFNEREIKNVGKILKNK